MILQGEALLDSEMCTQPNGEAFDAKRASVHITTLEAWLE